MPQPYDPLPTTAPPASSAELDRATPLHNLARMIADCEADGLPPEATEPMWRVYRGLAACETPEQLRWLREQCAAVLAADRARAGAS